MKVVFWNVDTQYDFMHKKGALYVPNAEEIIPSLEKLTDYANKKGHRIVLSRDAHNKKSVEFIKNGGKFPPHCLIKTKGYKNIPEGRPKKPLVLEAPSAEYEMLTLAMDPVYIKNLDVMLNHKGEIVFEKDCIDVFSNYFAEMFVGDLGSNDVAVVYGVATDYCVKAAAIGLSARGIETFVVTDAIKPVTEEGGKQALEDMVRNGVKLTTTADVLGGKYEKD